MPSKADSVKPAPKPAEPVAAKPKADTVAAPKKISKPKAVKDTTVLKKKIAAPKDTTAKAAVKPDTSVKKSIVAAKKESVPVKDTVSKVKVDSVKSPAAVVTPAIVAPSAPTPSPTVAADSVPKPRTKVVRETNINSISQKGKYRSPKRALFMSLLVPGLGQAYVGQSVFTYSRAAIYFSTDIVLGAFWYEYVVVKHDRQVSKYRSFADANWSQDKYEASAGSVKGTDEREFARKNYCDAVQEKATGTGVTYYNGCKDPTGDPADYASFSQYVHNRETTNPDTNHAIRAAFPDPYAFYEMIGQDQEFIAGWRDAKNVAFDKDSGFAGTSDFRDEYISMRAKANQYSRMQAWFVGGIVINHIASALDAALTARHYNRKLYETESAWYDRLNVDGGLVFEQGWPRTMMKATLSF